MQKWHEYLDRPVTIGGQLLAWYLVVVMIVSILEFRYGRHVVAVLASSPHAMVSGRWWTLFTSGLIIDGPKLPQIIAILTLGVIAIYTSGAWVFWRVAIAGHIVGTLLTYLGVWLALTFTPAHLSRLINAPDYGVSLIWCSALGAIAAICWKGTNKGKRSKPYLPVSFVACLVILFVVTWLSTGLAVYEHFVSFAVGYVIMYAHRPSRVRSAKLVTTGHAALHA